MTEKLRLSPDPLRSRAEVPEDRRTYASMWQDLILDRGSSEVDFLNGEIVRLGHKLGIPTPYNAGLLAIVKGMFEANLKPGLHTPAELRKLIRSSAEEHQN
jgi:2-dehydropantoate 2-reductase